jgi:hypothetical protein
LAGADRIAKWLLSDLSTTPAARGPERQHPWWQVMCLTGVDYFSTLGYQPGIAFLAAGFLSPIATLILVLVTLLAAYPVYRSVARQSPDGQGSIAMLERHFPQWKGKLFVLILLGFAATDFIITMTLSAADATSHILENPLVPLWMRQRMELTLLLLALLGAIFLRGFGEAIGVAVMLVSVYLFLNAIVLAAALSQVIHHPGLISGWIGHLWQEHGSPWAMLGLSLLLFPKLALGLSGFETGVAVMPLVRGELQQRIRRTQRLLLTAALIMSVFLMGSSLTTTLLIPPIEFQAGGKASGRALAYLAHLYLGPGFGTVYDISSIAILWFAGASAMAGLLNLVPRYLPRYGMAPEWARASRPLVLVFLGIAVAVTLLFRANVEAQGGAYATGVLFLMSSAAIAVTASVWKRALRWPFLLISFVFVYTTVANIFERPEGIKIASFFISATILVSLISRGLRSTELRITEVRLDDAARQFVSGDPDGVVRLVAHRTEDRSVEEYERKDAESRAAHNIDPGEQLLFLEIDRADASEFSGSLDVKGALVGNYKVLRASSAAIPNAIAALLIHVRDLTGRLPHAYFGWTEGNPVAFLFRFVFLGEGDVAPLTHEVLRKNIADRSKRPFVHVT